MTHRRRMHGITLIELMTVVVVVAILGTLAVGSYRSYMLRANRTDARTELLRIQQAQEKFFLQNNRYANAVELGLPRPTPNNYYTLTLENATNTTFSAVATAINGQLADTAACQRMWIDEEGRRGPAEADGCWR